MNSPLHRHRQPADPAWEDRRKNGPMTACHRPKNSPGEKRSRGARAPFTIDQRAGGGAATGSIWHELERCATMCRWNGIETPPIATPINKLVLFADGASSLLPSLHPSCGFRPFVEVKPGVQARQEPVGLACRKTPCPELALGRFLWTPSRKALGRVLSLASQSNCRSFLKVLLSPRLGLAGTMCVHAG